MFKVIGTSNDVTTCDCCGRTNLKRTIVLTNGEGEVHYGCDCAAKAIYGSKSKSDAEHLLKAGKAVEFAKKHIGQYPNWQIINAISVKFAIYACEAGNTIRICQDYRKQDEFVTVGE